MDKLTKVGFWELDNGNALSAGQGLTKDQINFLHSLKPGDRLILWYNDPNEKPSEMHPDFNLDKVKVK